MTKGGMASLMYTPNGQQMGTPGGPTPGNYNDMMNLYGKNSMNGSQSDMDTPGNSGLVR